MTISQSLSHAREILATSNIVNPALESELLLRHALKINRVQLYLGLDYELSPQEANAIDRQLGDSLSHAGLAQVDQYLGGGYR